MEHFLGFAIPGVPYGCTYAIVAVGLVLTYQATGVFNFAFGAQAYTSAFVFTKLVQNDSFPVWLAFLVAVVVLAPLLGLAFDRFLFRKIPSTNTTAKLVTGLALFVGIPALLPVLFGSQNLYDSPSIVFNPDIVYFRVLGNPINGIDLATVVVTAGVLVALMVLMRFTNLGLQMRGAVESRRLVELDGVNAGSVVATAWAISSLMAGLAGVLLAPIYGQLQAQDYATLLVAAFAAAAWATLRSLPIAVLVGILTGVADTVLQGYLPSSSALSAAVLPSLPFIVLVAALLLLPGLRHLDDTTDPMASVDPPPPPTTATLRAPQLSRIIRVAWYILLGAFVISMLSWMPKTWESVFNSGLAFSTIFLSITLITGMGGQLSLSQATLAGVGAFTAAQLASHLGLNLLAGAVVGAMLAAAVAVVLALASLRLKGLGLALMTIAAALFFDNSVFTQSAITATSSGQALNIRNSWIGLGVLDPSGHGLFLVEMVVLVLGVLGVLLVRSGTTGRYLTAMRGSETAAAGIGINLTWQRILIFALSGIVAGIGGTMLALQQQTVDPQQFNYQLSLAFVVIVVTTGVSTVEGAIQAGMGFVVIEQLLSYLPARFGGNSLAFVFFAAGALTYAAHPEGILEFQKRRWTLRFEHLLFPGRDPNLAYATASSTHGPGHNAAALPGHRPGPLDSTSASSPRAGASSLVADALAGAGLADQQGNGASPHADGAADDASDHTDDTQHAATNTAGSLQTRRRDDDLR